MYSLKNYKFIFTLFFPAIILPFVISSSIPPSPYEKFISFLLENNCSMPKELRHPFPVSSDPSPFGYLSSPLKECRTPEALKQFAESHMLCTEVFDVLKNITCVKYSEPLSVSESNFSTNVCEDFNSLKEILPQNEEYLSGRLVDNLICKVLCTAEKYELLCKTLFWSYDTLMKINNAAQTEVHKNGIGSTDKVSSDKVTQDTSSVKIPLKQDSEPNSQENKSTVNSKVHVDLEGEISLESNPNQTDLDHHGQKSSDDLGTITAQSTSSKNVLPDLKIQPEDIDKTENITKNIAALIPDNKSAFENKKLSLEVTENTAKTVDSEIMSNQNLQPEHLDDNENKINDEKVLERNRNGPQANLNKNSLAPNIKETKNNQNKNKLTDKTLVNENKKDDINSNVGMISSRKSDESVTSTTESENELHNNFPEEDKSKTKQTDLENQEAKGIEKPKQADYEGPNEVLPDTDSKLPEPSTLSALPDDDTEHQEDKDQEQYNNSFNLPPKNKEPETKNTVAANSNQGINDFVDISPKNDLARMTEEIAMIAPFPEQEDNHFFFYFLSIVLIIMAGYLIFHNKQKIIALIVEGRHERRRRSHGAGYKKLETK